jgi:hypothetical protein
MNTRFRLLLIVLGALLVAATYTFPSWQRLLSSSNTQATDELLTALSPELQPTFVALPNDQQTAYRQQASQNLQAALTMVNTALQPADALSDAIQALPSMSGPVVVASGEFTHLDAIRWAQGNVTVYQQADNSKIIRFENFNMVNGPELRVILSTSRDANVSETTPTQNLDVDLGALQGPFGNQNYEIPAELDLSRYNSIVIFSRSLNLIYSIAPLFQT